MPFKSTILALATAFLTVGTASAASADEGAKLDDVKKVIDVVKAAGCTTLQDIDVKSKGYKVSGVRCNDGKYYDIRIDKNFAIVKKSKDWF